MKDVAFGIVVLVEYLGTHIYQEKKGENRYLQYNNAPKSFSNGLPSRTAVAKHDFPFQTGYSS
jgi:hypothetical protein